MLLQGLKNIWPFMRSVCGGVVRTYTDYTTATYSEWEAIVFPGYASTGISASLGFTEEADYICVIRAPYYSTRAAKYASISNENHSRKYVIKRWSDVVGGFLIVTLVKTRSEEAL
jgi:hypothetical protein